MLHITIRQLRVFESVARHLSYTRAAEELYLSQPAVSMQIKQLEEHLGIPLFEQLGKKNYLTAAGKEMHHYSREMLRLLDEAEGVLQDIKGLHRGTLDISVATTANDFATRLLAAFSKEYEDLNYRLDVTNRGTLLDQLVANEKDLVIMGRPPRDMDLEVVPFMDNPLVVIASLDHELTKKKSIPLSRLTQETFVVRERASGTRIAMERFLSDHGVDVVTSMEMTSNEAIKQAVQAGLGLGVVSIHTVRLELETGRLKILDVEDFPIMRHWYVVHRKGKRLSPVASAFKEFILNQASEFELLPEVWRSRKD
ncbi:MAG: LysR family transcriptional regulator [Gammaproteobacteria bacterium]|nr:LysR family transcriptional regulator [Gammaproteobacteria bacterium]